MIKQSALFARRCALGTRQRNDKRPISRQQKCPGCHQSAKAIAFRRLFVTKRNLHSKPGGSHEVSFWHANMTHSKLANANRLINRALKKCEEGKGEKSPRRHRRPRVCTFYPLVAPAYLNALGGEALGPSTEQGLRLEIFPISLFRQFGSGRGLGLVHLQPSCSGGLCLPKTSMHTLSTPQSCIYASGPR